jgi:putative spermidine/putrescine transport system permease protein
MAGQRDIATGLPGGRFWTGFRFLSAGLLLIWLVLPLLPLAIWSFAKGWFFPDLLPRSWGLHAWEYVFSDTAGLLDSLGQSLAVALVVVLVSGLVGLPAGRALGLYHFRGKGLVELIILAPLIVPGIAVVMGLHSLFIGLGLTNNLAGVMLVHLIPTLPYMVLVMAGVFANYDLALEAQARALGASRIQVWLFIMMPSVLPGLIAGSLFAFLVSWSQYILTLMIGGGRVITLPLLLFNFATAGRHDITGALALIYILPGVIILLVMAGYLTGRGPALSREGRP